MGDPMAYAEPCRRPGEISTSEASAEIGCHRKTLYRWADEALGGGRSPIGPGDVRRAPVSRTLWWRREKVLMIANEIPDPSRL
jgi:hypothetical protein